MNLLNINGYNVDIAKVLGICQSILLSCIDEERQFQIRHKLISDNDTVPLSRQEIYERTAMSDEDQKKAEESLVACGVLVIKPLRNVPNKNYYIINLDQIKKISESEKPEEVVSAAEIAQFIRKPRVEPMSKRQTHINSLKRTIKTDDPVIQQYLCEWIDAVYTNPKGFLSPSSVNIAQQELEQYAKGSQSTKIALLKIAIKGGLRDITWAINTYEKEHCVNSSNFAVYNDIKSDGSNVVNEVF